MSRRCITVMVVTLVGAIFVLTATAMAVNLKPYVLAYETEKGLDEVVGEVRSKLSSSGFDLVGEYRVDEKRHLVVITNDEIKNMAAKSKFGGFGAVVRVGITSVGKKVQVSYTNPPYWANAYQLKDDLSGVFKRLKSSIGFEKEFGSEDGIEAEDLREYHYMFAMPYFEDFLNIGRAESYEAAIKRVEEGFKSGKSGVKKIYRVDIPGKEETVYGVGITKGDGSDLHILEKIDTAELKHTAYLPYELLVSGNRIYALHGKFRIAISWPDLGLGTFMTISSAPGGIEDALKELVNR
ncbi:MAG: hypothetical protein D6726_12070 [Nitrospirae bacterium]|nr:MAG: hypothetical protein D6726_12070 [Nitrospirota bacterium]